MRARAAPVEHSAVPGQTRAAPVEHSAASEQARSAISKHSAAPGRARSAILSHLRLRGGLEQLFRASCGSGPGSSGPMQQISAFSRPSKQSPGAAPKSPAPKQTV